MINSHGWLTTLARASLLSLLSMASALGQSTSPAPDLAATAPVSVLTLPVGQSLLLRYPNIRRVSAADGAVVDVKVFEDTQEVMLLGKKEGLTDLRLWTRDGNTLAYLVKVLGIPDPPTAPPHLEAEPTIRIKAKLIEVKKSALHDIGIDWADVAQGPVFGAFDELVTNKHFRVIPEGVELSGPNIDSLPLNIGSSNHYAAFTTVVDSVVNMLINNGDARTLAEPTLTCISGGEADFLVGGEVPIPVQNQDGALNVIFKQFGIILNVAPRSDETGLIRTKVGVEVSSLDKAISVQGFPGFATRKTNTEMNVKSGASMVVAGLFSSDDAKTVVKVPGLGNIPILGELFKSRQFRRGETELVVIVTPQVIDVESEDMKSRVRQYDELKNKSDAALKPKLQD